MKKIAIRFLFTMFFSIATAAPASAVLVISDGETAGEWLKNGGASNASTSNSGGAVGKFTNFGYWVGNLSYNNWILANNPGSDLTPYKHNSTDFYIKRNDSKTLYVQLIFTGTNAANVNTKIGVKVILNNANINSLNTWYAVHVETDVRGLFTLDGAQINGSPLVGGEITIPSDLAGGGMSNADLNSFWGHFSGVRLEVTNNPGTGNWGIDQLRMTTLATPTIIILR